MKPVIGAIMSSLITTLILSFTSVAFGQSGAGSITGTVKDSNGAAVAGAIVTIVNPAKSIAQTATANEDGIFVFPQLPPGDYTISVEKVGFKKVEKSNVVLSTADKLNAGDFVLAVGEVAETIQVQADTGQLQLKSESGERSDLITNRQIRDIAINGRNILDLTRVTPGIINVNQQAQSTVNNAGGTFTVNGLRSNMHEITLDGATNFNLGNNTGLLVTISPDAVAEFKVLTSNYQAEYGRAAGGFVQVVTRSGTNEFHGGGRYFRRHDSLNANSFFNNARELPRSIYRYNFYGYDIGGPVYLPKSVFGPLGGFNKDRNRLFFFYSQEVYRQKIPSASNNVRVPTAAERGGDFSNSRDTNGNLIIVRDANNCLGNGIGASFPGNIIPQRCWYSNGQTILNLYPQPNTTVSNNAFNYTSQISSSLPRGEQVVRVDYNIGERAHFSFRVNHNTDQQIFPYGTTTATFNFPLVPVARGNGPGWVFGYNLTYNITPTLVNEFNYAPSYGAVFIKMDGEAGLRGGTGINTPLLFPDANVGGAIPSFSYDTNIAGATGFSGITYADMNIFGSPFNQHFVIHNFIDNLTKVAGNHTIKTGFYWQIGHNKRSSFSPVQSNIEFNFGTADASNSLNTGYPFANALVGNYFQYQQASAQLQNDFVYNNIEGYIQDTWKVTPRLTLDYGLRLSYYQPMYDKEGQFANFDSKLFDPSKAVRLYFPVCINAVSTCPSGANRRAVDPVLLIPGFVPTASNTLPTQFIGTIVPNSGSLTNGIARAADGAPRGGFKSDKILFGPRFGFAVDLTGKQKTVLRGGFGITYDRVNSDVTIQTITNPPNTFTPNLYFGRLNEIPSLSATGGALAPLSIFGAETGGEIPTVYSYSLGIQHNLTWGTVVDVSYVGNVARHLVRLRNLNAIPYGATFTRAGQDPTRYAGGVIPAVEPNLPTAYSQAGVNFTGSNALANDFLRPYPGYGDIQLQSFDAISNYNSLQVGITRRFSNRLTFGVAYAFSKTLTDSNAVNEFTHPYDNRHYDYALASFDRAHVLVINYVYDLPKVGRYLGNHSLTRGIFDNWQISGISQFVSGTPFELSLSGLGGQGARLIGTPTSQGTSSLAGLQPRFNLVGDPRQRSNGLQINPNAFAVPGIGDTRSQPRFYLRNPGWNNHDVSIFKNFPFGGEGRRYLQLRFEFFNILNQAQFSGIQQGSVTITPGSPMPVFNLRPAGSTDALGTFFGEYNATRDPRIIQLAAKVYF
jgi:Carboxypeptidase regulatory-like domain/TonB-dependent Receptor Plug Domain